MEFHLLPAYFTKRTKDVPVAIVSRVLFTKVNMFEVIETKKRVIEPHQRDLLTALSSGQEQ